MVSLTPNERVLKKDNAKYRDTRGTLCLTTKKLVFDYEQRGIFFKGKYTSITLPLERIAELSVVGIGPFKKLAVNVVRDKPSFGLPRHEFKVSEPDVWRIEIEVAKQQQTPSPQVVKEIVKEIVKVRCPYCGTLTESTLPNCPNCGGHI